MKSIVFAAPPAFRSGRRIHPVFLPFLGCPTRCVFCEQTLQTGHGQPGAGRASAAPILSGLESDLAALAEQGAPPRELAFYGGTFTLLPREAQAAGLDLAAAYRKKGLITAVRASTRPDALDMGHLAALRKRGLDMLELGVQSFADIPLAASSRGYAGEIARRGCRMVKEAGLRLGIQLMPGMPGMEEADYARDMDIAVALAPDALRFYPCLVLAGTELARMYRSGAFVPWTLERTVPLLAAAQLQAWEADIPVIRMGLAPQKELDNGGIVAGPSHPALGSMVRGLALFRFLEARLRPHAAPVRAVRAPRRLQGDFWGHAGSLKERYAEFGITPRNTAWNDGDHIEVTLDDPAQENVPTGQLAG